MNYTGDISTIIKFIVMTIAPAVGIDEVTGDALVSVLVAVVGFILAWFDAAHPNTLSFFNNGDDDEGA